MAATVHSRVLPYTSATGTAGALIGTQQASAMTGHAHRAGRSRYSAEAMMPSGTAHHRTAGRNTNGTNRYSAVGG